MSQQSRTNYQFVAVTAIVGVLFAGSSSFAAAATEANEADEAPLIALVLQPAELDSGAGTAALNVEMTISNVDWAHGEAVLTHQIGSPGMTKPIIVQNLALLDSSGVVPITRTMDNNQGLDVWKTPRAVSGPVTASYQTLLDNSSGGILTTTPHVDGEGLFGIGNMLLLTPQLEGSCRISIAWDLSAMPEGAQGVTNAGEGNVTMPAGPVSRLQHTMFMAGMIKRHPKPSTSVFAAVWTGSPQFDVRSAMHWTEQLYHWMSAFFRDPTEPLYRVFLRKMPHRNGVAAPHAFALGYDADTTAGGVKALLGHEMTHTWTTNELGKWYTEGLAVYYQVQLPWRAGLISTEKYLEDINLTAARYYTNSAINAPDTDILPYFWTDKRYSVLPYDRGAMYFAVLSGKLKRASNGERSIDDLIRMMVDRGRKEQPITEQVWIDLLRKELGKGGPELHRSMLEGEVMVPGSGSFSPCFRRTRTKARPFELGFGGAALKTYRVVKNLRPDSAAAKAGLREGDQVDYRISTTMLRDPNLSLTLNVTRDGETFPITYLPRGEPVEIYQWERAADVTESSCR